ncbi:response regulator [Thiorhodococcus mannitoliphagus]|uniref:Response regulator n=1 Tax=Thiorhodococcus mannitoliphagus TaxID=329406 RepID=A0A6P1DPY8_9GAMM|nr:response regulator [Thiorhodococcus mannitoliphagus]NEX19979.1 response regulator [Thiorhodococcus mannitoliphagus]
MSSPAARYDATAPLRLLVVEDNPADLRLIELILSGSGIDVDAAECLTTAEAQLNQVQGQRGLDLVLLDLGLPDSQELDGLARLLEMAPGLPIVVMTGLDDDRLGFEALSLGAEDFIQKDWLNDAALVQRTLRFAWERNRLRRRLQAAEREREALAMDRIDAGTKLKVSAGAFGLRPLRESDAKLFAEIRDAYGGILAAAAERQVYQVEHPVSEQLRKLADRLGFVRASPRDLVDLHTAALAALTPAVGPAEERLLVSEGRITILELMGYLASYYRRYYVGSMGIRSVEE